MNEIDEKNEKVAESAEKVKNPELNLVDISSTSQVSVNQFEKNSTVKQEDLPQKISFEGSNIFAQPESSLKSNFSTSDGDEEMLIARGIRERPRRENPERKAPERRQPGDDPDRRQPGDDPDRRQPGDDPDRRKPGDDPDRPKREWKRTTEFRY